MKKRIAILFHGAMAHYEIEVNILGSYTASLLEYEGRMDSNPPPTVVTLYLHGELWLGNPGDQDLLDDIGDKILD